MASAPTSATQPLSASSGRHEGAASDSDDDDVAFAYMNFQGVDFGEATCESVTKENEAEEKPSQDPDEDMPVVEDGDDGGPGGLVHASASRQALEERSNGGGSSAGLDNLTTAKVHGLQ